MTDIPHHFHKIDRINERDLIPDDVVLPALPSTAAEGTRVSVEDGGSIRFYRFLKGVWREIGSGMKTIIGSNFESLSRFVQAQVTGTFAANTLGITVAAGNGVSGGYAQLRWQPGGTSTELKLFDYNPQMNMVVRGNNLSNGGGAYFGIGAVTNGTEHTFTNKHIGFKLTGTPGNPFNLRATQGDGTTETASDILTTITNDDALELTIAVGGSVIYGYRKNGGVLSTVTLSANKPTGSGSTLQFSVSTDGYINPIGMDVLSFNYQR